MTSVKKYCIYALISLAAAIIPAVIPAAGAQESKSESDVPIPIIELVQLPEVGETLAADLPDEIYGRSYYMMTTPSQFDPFFIARVDGVSYEVAFNKGRSITFITTSDTTFKSPEGITVGMHMTEALKIAGADGLSTIRGFAYYIPLESGWNAGFGVDDYDREILAEDSTVTWFFR
jgi:hypothetical protein